MQQQLLLLLLAHPPGTDLLFICVLPLLQLYKWDFSVFDLHKLTKGRPLYHVTMGLLQDQGLLVRVPSLCRHF